MRRFAFQKQNRLAHRKEIDMLFNTGISFSIPPVRIVYLATESGSNRILFSVSRKKFRRAIDRNRIKRLMREAFRLNQEMVPVLGDGTKSLNIAFIYTGSKADITLWEIEKALIAGIKKIGLT